jgi:KTSC domain
MATLIQTPNSSMFSGYEYDDVAWILTLHLKNGKSYEYVDFGPEDFEEFTSAKSLGTHYNTRIKGTFESREVTAAPAPNPVKEQLKASVAQEEKRIGVKGISSSPSKTCEEASPLSKEFYIACGKPAVAQVYHKRDNTTLAMCAGCADHNVRNRGAMYLGDAIRSAPGVVETRLMTHVEADKMKEELGITDEDIRLAHPGYKGQQANGLDGISDNQRGIPAPNTAEVTPEILSPEQALAVMAPKNPKVDELTRRAHALAGKVLTVTDSATQKVMEDHLVQLATVRKAIFELVDPYRAIAYAAYEAVQQLNKGRLDPIDNAVMTGKNVLKVWLQAERAKAEAEQRRLDAEARKRAEEEQCQRTEQMRLEAAEQKQAEGDTVGAEASLFDQAIQAPPVYTPPVRVERPTSSLGKNGGVQENWKAEVSDLEEVILDVAAGIQAFRQCGNLQGHLPTTLITINPTILKGLATNNRSMANFPGIRVWDDGKIAVRTVKE